MKDYDNSTEPDYLMDEFDAFLSKLNPINWFKKKGQ